MAIRGIASMAMRHVLVDCADAYRASTGQTVDIVCVGGVEAARRVEEGEPFDCVVLAAEAIDRLAAARRVEWGRTDLARSAIAVAVARGAPRPDLSDGAAVRDAVLGAATIGYSTGPSGAYLVRLFERWGILPAVASRLVQAPPGVPVGALLMRGEAVLGFQQLSELLHEPGIDVVGMLPADIQSATTFSAGICTPSRCPDAARAFLDYVASSACDAAKRRHGMAPARGASP